MAEEMIAVAERAGDREAALQGRNWRVVDLFELGRIDDAGRRSPTTRRWPTRCGCRPIAGTSRCGGACARLLEGRYAEAAQECASGRASSGSLPATSNAELFAAMLE